MAAGDLITADWQLELDGYLMGAGQTWDNDEGPWTGVVGLGVRAKDAEYDLADGDVLGTDTNPARLFTAPLIAHKLTVSDTFQQAEDLEALWSASATNQELHLQLPGLGHRYLVGRPRGAAIDLALVRTGTVRALVTFKAGDPTLYTVEGGS